MLLHPEKPSLVLAPMEGVTDAPMRALLGELGAFDYGVSEFLRISQEIPPAKVFYKHIPELKTGAKTLSKLPVQVQLLGGSPERMARAAALACELGAPGIDLNFGCPAPTVNRHDGGATLLKFPRRIRAIVEAVREAVPKALPVSAKLRLGWDDMEAIHENAERAAEGGASWITIHGRTKYQGYTPPAYWKPIGEVKRKLGIPVIANGEIWTLQDFVRCREETGCDHFMLGRGALADPFLASKIKAVLMGNQSTDKEGGLPSVVSEEWQPAFAVADQSRPASVVSDQSRPASVVSDQSRPASVVSDQSRSASVVSDQWRPILQRFIFWNESFPKDSPNYSLRRIKQWLKYAHLRKNINWFDTVKRTESLEEFFRAMP